MRTIYRQPKGSSNILGGLVVGLLGGLIGVGIACLVGWICNSGGGGGGGSVAGNVTPGQACSVTNACGQSTLGTYADNGNRTASCNAVADNSTCPPPVIDRATGFTANPSTVGANGVSTLTWNAANATDCSIRGDNGFTASGGSTGSAATAPLTQTTIFTLTCTDGAGGPSASASLRVIVDPHYKEI